MEDSLRRGKKRRLDHLTLEEKVQRKKLKNRVAAQTSRDRKKMKMDEMEDNLLRLSNENDTLRTNFASLEHDNRRLQRQNELLQQQLNELRQTVKDQERRIAEQEHDRVENNRQRRPSSSLSAAVAEKTDLALETGSAASNDVDPLQKGWLVPNSNSSSNAPTMKTTTSAVWQVIALCLLYKICSKQAPSAETTSNCMPGKSWPKLCSQISPDKLQQMLLQVSAKLPRLQAAHHTCLDNWWWAAPEPGAWNPPGKVQA